MDPNNVNSKGNSPAAIGNRVAATILKTGQKDGSNEANAYADTSGYVFIDPPIQPQYAGTSLKDPNRWQRLLLPQPFTQNGIPQNGAQPFMGAHWGSVKPFAINRPTADATYYDAGPTPTVQNPLMRERWIPDLLRKQAALDASSTRSIDAADECGQSRIWGGIHIEPDDLVGRKIGHKVGLVANQRARAYFAGQ